MKQFLKSVLASLTSETPRPERRACLRVEGLEDRWAPASVGSVRAIIAINSGLESPLAMRGFNPQPEPPGHGALLGG